MVRAAIDARMATAAMAANEVFARVAERRVLRPAGFHRSYRQRLFVGHYLLNRRGPPSMPRAEPGIHDLNR